MGKVSFSERVFRLANHSGTVQKKSCGSGRFHPSLPLELCRSQLKGTQACQQQELYAMLLRDEQDKETKK